MALIGYNCNVNRSISTKMGIPLLGCDTHRFREILDEEDNSVKQVRQLMKKLHTPLISANLRRETHLKPKVGNETRCSLLYEMILRMVQLLDPLVQLDQVEIDNFLLSPATECRMYSRQASKEGKRASERLRIYSVQM